MINQRLSRQDSMFFAAETPTTPQVGGLVSILESPVSYEELLDWMARVVDAAPRLRQRVEFVPYRLHRPVWVDDEDFDVRRHVKRITVQAPGAAEQLLELAAATVPRPLDLRHPAWDVSLVEGLAGARSAVVLRLHHSIADGVGGAAMLMRIQMQQGELLAGDPREWTPLPAPGRAELAAQAIADRRVEVSATLRRIARARPNLPSALRTVRSIVEAATDRGPPLPLNAVHGAARRILVVHAMLDDYRAIRAAFGCTINDVVLATVAGGLRDWLHARGLTEARTVRAAVPVSMRAPEERDDLGNRVSNLFVHLPVWNPDPVDRLRRITTDMREAKASPATRQVDRILQVGPPWMLGKLMHVPASRRVFNVIVSNVAGPQTAMTYAGRRVVSSFIVPPLNPHQALGIVVLSDAGRMTTSVLVDPDLIPDADAIADGTERALWELLDAAKRR